MEIRTEICRVCGGDGMNSKGDACDECGGDGYITWGNCKKCKEK